MKEKDAKDKAKKISDELQRLITSSDESDDFPRLELGPLGSTPVSTRMEFGPLGLAPAEPVQKLTRDIIAKIEAIRTKAEQTEIFDEAFALVLKLKLVIPVLVVAFFLLFLFVIYIMFPPPPPPFVFIFIFYGNFLT